MDAQKFIENFAAQFEEINSTSLSLESRFREIEEWSSLIGLSIIAMVDEIYKVKLKGEDIRQSKTVGDLFEIVKTRMH